MRHARGLLDTSVVIEFNDLDDSALPYESMISSITLGELAAGPHGTADPAKRAHRQERLQQIESALDVLSFDAASARAFGRIWGAISAIGRKPRGGRPVDLLIAATALAEGLPLYTLNPADLRGLEDLIEVVPVAHAS